MGSNYAVAVGSEVVKTCWNQMRLPFFALYEVYYKEEVQNLLLGEI
jgi:hypothetical protein